MKQIRWGILSTAKIGVEKVIPALQQSTHGLVAAIASRSQKRANEVAAALNIPTVHGSYKALLTDKTIDAIYNPLPNHLHLPWTQKALAAGKHVLCEKPIGLSAQEARTLQHAAQEHPGLKVMEGFMYRFHPQWQQARQWLQNGRIGELQTVHSHFSYFNDDPQNIRNQPDLGGGALMDIGCYNLSLSRFLFDAEPQRLTASVENDPSLGIDRLVSGVLEFSGGTATFTCATQIAPDQGVIIYGSNGRITLHTPFNAPQNAGVNIVLHTDDSAPVQKKITADQYALQADAFAQSIINNTPVPTPLTDAVANMQLIDAVFESAREGRWVQL